MGKNHDYHNGAVCTYFQACCWNVCATPIFVMVSIALGVSGQITTMGLHIPWGLVYDVHSLQLQEAKFFKKSLERS